MFGLFRGFLLLTAAHECMAFTLLLSPQLYSSYEFIQQLRIHENSKTICNENSVYSHCDIVLKTSYDYRTQHLKTIHTLKAALQEFPKEQVFFMAEDGVLPDYDYISSVANEIKYKRNLYFGAARNCTVRQDGSNPPVCMDEDFYGISRPIAKCFVETAIQNITISSNQASFFGDTIYRNCKHLNIDYGYRNESLIWSRMFYDMNKCINLNFIHGKEKCQRF
ncbi:hypothetical protein BGW37DRAFT_39290 [Umbelopsis sp. PMI_123]|nr:hypothetical protein BGW37DRAFT_39290 [Umbelopsis sp. PMI_123]